MATAKDETNDEIKQLRAEIKQLRAQERESFKFAQDTVKAARPAWRLKRAVEQAILKMNPDLFLEEATAKAYEQARCDAEIEGRKHFAMLKEKALANAELLAKGLKKAPASARLEYVLKVIADLDKDVQQEVFADFAHKSLASGLLIWEDETLIPLPMTFDKAANCLNVQLEEKTLHISVRSIAREKEVAK